MQRDNIIDLCSQIEYCVDDLLKEEKDKIFINNPNIEAIEVKDDDFVKKSLKNKGVLFLGDGSVKELYLKEKNLYFKRQFLLNSL